MFPYDSPMFVSVSLAVAAVTGAALMLWLLRRMRVRVKYLAWTVAAHAAFILLLGLAVAPASQRSRTLEEEAMTVVMLPPIAEEEEEEDEAPVEFVVPPPKTVRVVPPDQMPETARDVSRVSRYLGLPSSPGVASSRLQAMAPRESAAEFGTRGVPTKRAELGELHGPKVTATPGLIPHAATGESATMRALEPRGDRTATAVYDRHRSDTRADVSGPDVERGSEIGLPSGYSLGGDVQGRKAHLPPALEVHTTEAGTVKVRFWVSADGRVYDINIIKRSGSPVLDQEARRWVERIKFAPLDPGINPKAQSGEIEIDFSKVR